jgi:UDP-glucose 4-epimerase
MFGNNRILVTGGAGFIGSHTCVQLLEQGYKVTVLDNLSNSSPVALDRVKAITGKELDFVQGDIRNPEDLKTLFSNQSFDAVIHFAGLKAVGESVAQPLIYYQNNVTGTLNLLKAMEDAGLHSLVFSSSATVYGDPQILPIPETAPCAATNPYGRSKLIIEEILSDLAASDPRWKIANLRYFNPVGAHSSGLIGEDPRGIPNNLMPYISQVAIGTRDCLTVFGQDYPTPDGTGVRVYIHVVDLAAGHLSALDYLFSISAGELLTVNLGTGRGISVLEMVKTFEAVNGCKVPYRIAERRPGDVAACYADPSLAQKKLGWKARLDVGHMCEDTWRWQKANPAGYHC